MRLLPHTIGSKLVLAIGLASVLAIGGISLIAYKTGRTSLLAQANAQASAKVQTAANAMDEAVNRLAYVPRMLAAYQAGVGREPEPYLEYVIRNLLRRVPAREIFGIYIAFDAKPAYDPRGMIWMDRASWPALRRADYDYRDAGQDWYAGAKAGRRFHLSEPFFDRGGAPVAMVSLTFPVIVNNAFIGVSGVDLPLSEIGALLRRAGGGSNLLYLASPTGRLLVHPDASLLPREGSPGASIADLPLG